MEISEIKTKLTMATVLHYYGLKTDKQSRISCPFHEDKTPSMQVYYKTQTAYCFSSNCKTQTAYCFSSNCKTHGKSMDVIDFVMYKEGFDKLDPQQAKRKAILKAQSLLTGESQPGFKLV